MYALPLIAPLFITISVGYILRTTRMFSTNGLEDLNHLLSRVILPVLLFSSTRTIRFEGLGVAAATLVFAMGVTTLIAFLVAFNLPGWRRGAFVQSCFRGNILYVGTPVVAVLLDQSALAISAAVMAVALFVHVVLSIAVLELFNPKRQKVNVAGALVSVFQNPLIISVVLGMLVSALRIPIPGLLVRTLDIIGRAGLPLALLVIGGELRFSELRKNAVPAGVAALLKLGVMPAIAWFVGPNFFGVTGSVLAAIVLLAVSPTAIITQVFAAAYHSDRSLSSTAVALSTLLSVIAFPLWATILGV